MPVREFGVSMRHGRGGAGNFEIASQETARAAADLEANQPPGDSSQTSSPVDLVQRQAPSYVGRGGAGNYGSTEDPDNWDTLDRTTSEPFANSRKDSQAQSPTQGRGGAGNYAAGNAVGNAAYQLYLTRRMTEDDQKREKLKADIEQGVNKQLAVPQKAKLPGANP